MATTTTTTEEEHQPENKNIKKKRKVGLATADADTVRKVVDMGQKARLLTLKKMKEENDGLPLSMGLATLYKATRQKIARLGGLARAADKAGLSKAGKRGGLAVKASYGIEYYSELGVKGGGTTLERYSITYFSDLGKKGNISKKRKKNDNNSSVDSSRDIKQL